MASAPTQYPPEAPYECAICPRLLAYREANAANHADWHNGPVDSFGDEDGRLLIVGLAPGVTGANRTGRPFTGDWAGDLLYSTLGKFGLSNDKYDCRSDDGLELTDTLITNAVRCVPPENKPTAKEINDCRPYLVSRLENMKNLQVVLALGLIAHQSTLRALGEKVSAHKFTHGACHEVWLGGHPLLLVNSYHCSRYNTNTGRLTEKMFHDVFRTIQTKLGR